MTNMHTKLLLPLAALALASAACDPFPAAPGGAPAIVRVITYGPSGDSNTVETVTGGNTVSTDYAWVDSVIRVQFNKPMDGSTIQAYPNYDDKGQPFVPPAGADPCTPATGLVLTNFDAATLVCYDPASATDGGSLVVYPGAELVYGTVYTIGGTVKDYEGKSITLNVTVKVDARPLPFHRSTDGYSIGLDWFDSGADSYQVFRGAAAAGPWTSVAVIDPLVDCGGGWCGLYYDTMLVPNTSYYYKLTETTAGVTTDRPAVAGPVTTVSPLLPSFGVTTTTTVPPVIIPGVIRVSWGTVADATGYDLERADDNAGAPGTWVSLGVKTAPPFLDGGPAAGTPLAGTLTPGTKYWYRVTPVFAAPPAGYVPVKGRAGSKVSP